MGIEETINEFIEIWNLVFADATLDQAARSAKLEVAIKDILKQRGMMEGQHMHTDGQEESSCKAYLLTIQ